MTWLARLLCAGLLAAAATSSVHAQTPPTPPASLDAAARAAVVEAAAGALRERYVYPDVGEEAAAAIEAALAAGDYADLEEPWAFAQRLTADLQNVTKDKHLSVVAPGPAPASATPDASSPPGRLHSEGGVSRADLLPDNIGYIELIAFPGPDMFKPAVDRAMAALADTRALIIDGRRNGGGSPVSVAHLVSYFLEEGAQPVKINEFHWRDPGAETYRVDEFWSAPAPFSYAGKPVYVLTSARTFSGGEEFAYDMQVMGLATIVGETTGGGANPVGPAPLPSGLSMAVPGGYARNAITGTNWEGVGVTPDIETPVADALRVALAELGVTTDETDIDALTEARVFEARSTPNPDAEAAVRRMSEENARGEPNYDLLSEGLAEATRTQLASLQEMFTALGPLQSVTFVEVGPMGADVYEVEYANGSLIWRIAVNPDGKTAMAGVRPAPSPAGGDE